ncbi:amidohydrolase family protein [Desulfosporosinus sp.]|uniref:dihydroorotase n=1 Tax=Desulfosporosinus sp. TaxID=157907 RepID=UPI0025C0C57A|nr:amidohydrolase family protein [Desulfosporosinus sp.]MBC2722060.1 amidohydrolase family protein [Desulfosporosinus sp.]MBC2725921.1 amidohydrolase family protein [Desulfosporosinus sp.]
MGQLVLKDGRLVIPGQGIVEADVAMENGKIVAIGTGLSGEKEISVAGKYVLPGLIDPHIHLGIFGDLAEEMEKETASALLGGITTVGAFMGGPNPYMSYFKDVINLADAKAAADVFFHLAIMTPEQQSEITSYAKELGITSFKMYMSGIPGLIPDVDDGFMLQTLETVAALGDKAIVCVHAENPHLIRVATEKVKARGSETLADWADTHPNAAEEDAVRRAAYLNDLAGGRMYIVHVSTAESVRALAELKPRYPKLFAETTSPYLSIDKFSPLGLVAHMVPPFREPESVDALWQGLASGLLDTVGTDNVTLTLDLKGAEKGIWGAMPGYPAVGTSLPVMLHYGVNSGKLDLIRLVEVMGKNPAEIYGLYPRKGTITPGSDADLVVIDLDLVKTVRHEELGSRADFSLYDGQELKGWPVMTIKGGQVAVIDGKMVSEAEGRFLKRSL